MKGLSPSKCNNKYTESNILKPSHLRVFAPGAVTVEVIRGVLRAGGGRGRGRGLGLPPLADSLGSSPRAGRSPGKLPVRLPVSDVEAGDLRIA